MENETKPFSSFKENKVYSFIKRHGKHILVVLCLFVFLVLKCCLEKIREPREFMLSIAYSILTVFIYFIPSLFVLYVLKKRKKNVDLLAIIVMSFLQIAAFTIANNLIH